MSIVSKTIGSAASTGSGLKRNIAVVLWEECDLIAVCTVAEVFASANALSAGETSGIRYEMHPLSTNGGRIRCAPAMSVSTQALADLSDQQFDQVLLAHAVGTQGVPDDIVQTSWLQRMRNGGAVIRLLCADNNATLPAKDGQRWPPLTTQTTRHRVSPALRVAFDVIRLDLGDHIAQEAVRLATGAADLPLPVDGPMSPADKARSAARWLRENCHRSIAVNEAANACALSERSLLRHFQTYLNTSPSEYLLRVRLELACEMLTTTSLPADKIARRVGLNSGNRFGKILRRVTGMSPTEYRIAKLERHAA